MGMVRTALGLLAVMALATPVAAEPAVQGIRRAPADVSAQAQRPPRLRVYPGRPLYRECDFKLVQQWRPGGPVIVPWQRCWWVRG